MNKKYELTDETINHYGVVLHRIKALRSFGDVKAGDLGGFIESEDNLSQEGMANILGVNQTTVGQWLNGKKKPGYDSILLLYEKFGVTPNELFGID